MKKYLLKSKKYGLDFFQAEDNEDAEQYVDETYDEDDGPMQLFQLDPVCSWQ